MGNFDFGSVNTSPDDITILDNKSISQYINEQMELRIMETYGSDCIINFPSLGIIDDALLLYPTDIFSMPRFTWYISQVELLFGHLIDASGLKIISSQNVIIWVNSKYVIDADIVRAIKFSRRLLRYDLNYSKPEKLLPVTIEVVMEFKGKINMDRIRILCEDAKTIHDGLIKSNIALDEIFVTQNTWDIPGEIERFRVNGRIGRVSLDYTMYPIKPTFQKFLLLLLAAVKNHKELDWKVINDPVVQDFIDTCDYLTQAYTDTLCHTHGSQTVKHTPGV